MWVAVRSN